MTKIISVLQLISIIASDHGEKERGSVKRKATSERQKIGRRKQHSTGIGLLFVDAKFRRLMVELNLYKTEGRNNRPQLREWSYTLSFYWRVKCTAISRKKEGPEWEPMSISAIPVIIWKLP